MRLLTWVRERVSTAKYLIRFPDRHYAIIVDHAKYGLSGTSKRVQRLYPEIVGITYFVPDCRARKEIDIRFFT